MKKWPHILLLGALAISAPCFAETDVPVVPVVGSADYRFLKMEKELPGFGGMFLDDNEVLNVYMLYPEVSAPELDTSVRASPLLTRKEAAASINVIPGQYAFSTLAKWRDRLLPALAFKGVVFLDIDETRNRLVIGVSDPAPIRVVRNKVLSSKIPQKALLFRNAEPFHQLTTLNDTFRPVIGGVHIEDISRTVCSLGFNATLDARKGFVTNSHCTKTQGQLDDAYAFYQPGFLWDFAINLVGREFNDPAYFTSPSCPSNVKGCRYSDSVFVEYDSGIESTLGALARTFETEGGNIIDETNPIYTITREDCGGIGDLVYKEGATTGYTTGRISQTCVALIQPENPNNQLLPCQNVAESVLGDLVAAGGDSGSPVFTYNSDGTVTLAGLLWGGMNPNSFVYSCIGSVKADLGQQLITYQAPSGQPLITDVSFPSSIPGDGMPRDGTVTFTDADTGVDWAQFNVLQLTPTCDPSNPNCFPSFGFDPGVSDLTNGQITFNMWCQGDFYWTMEVTLYDLQGNRSNPWLFTVKCDPVSAQGTLILPGPGRVGDNRFEQSSGSI